MIRFRVKRIGKDHTMFPSTRLSALVTALACVVVLASCAKPVPPGQDTTTTQDNAPPEESFIEHMLEHLSGFGDDPPALSG